MNAEDGTLKPEAEAENAICGRAVAQSSNSPIPRPGGRVRSAAGIGWLVFACASAHQPRRPTAHPVHHLLELPHLLHRLLHGRKPVEHRVQLSRGNAAAFGNPLAPASVEDGRVCEGAPKIDTLAVLNDLRG